LILQTENFLLRHQIMLQFVRCTLQNQAQKTLTRTLTKVEQTVNHKKRLLTTTCARPCAWCHF
jgi:hypothetical protein